mgnify:CR=1 FL=1
MSQDFEIVLNADWADLIKRIKPDIVVFTGDLVDKDIELSNDDYKYLTSQFSEINAKYGKFSILGNHDYDEMDKVLSVFNNVLKVILCVAINFTNPIKSGRITSAPSFSKRSACAINLSSDSVSEIPSSSNLFLISVAFDFDMNTHSDKSGEKFSFNVAFLIAV